MKILACILPFAIGQAASSWLDARSHPGSAAWPAFPITQAEFEAANGSTLAGWKRDWEASENSELPYNVVDSARALMEIKGLMLEDPMEITTNWLWGIHPCGFSQVICNQHGVVVGVDFSGIDPHAVLDDVELRLRLYDVVPVGTTKLKALPDGELWRLLGAMSLKIMRFDNVRSAAIVIGCDTHRLEETQVPESWGSYLLLEEISLGSLGLSGKLPTQWGNLGQLKRLDLSNNDLHGILPAEWSALDHLQHLDISQHGSRSNGLVGGLPPEWETLEKLLMLDLTNQKVSGTLPEPWVAMSALQVLSLTNTSISGRLPESWGSMQNLTTVSLANTAVSGQLPASWGNMQNLTWLDLRNTNILGRLPKSWHSFCSGLRTFEALPAFVYLPWQGTTAYNSVWSTECIRHRWWNRVQDIAFLSAGLLGLFLGFWLTTSKLLRHLIKDTHSKTR